MSLDYFFGYPDPSLGRGRAGLHNFSDLVYFSRVGPLRVSVRGLRGIRCSRVHQRGDRTVG